MQEEKFSSTFKPFEEFLKQNYKEKVEENQMKKFPKRFFNKQGKEIKK